MARRIWLLRRIFCVASGIFVGIVLGQYLYQHFENLDPGAADNLEASVFLSATAAVWTWIILLFVTGLFSPYIFISYARADRRYARRLRRRLRFKGIRVWMDSQLRAGDVWRAELRRRVAKSAGLIVVVTPEANNSEWVREEIRCAEAARRPVIPILKRGAPNEGISGRYHGYDARRRLTGMPSAKFYSMVWRATGS